MACARAVCQSSCRLECVPHDTVLIALVACSARYDSVNNSFAKVFCASASVAPANPRLSSIRHRFSSEPGDAPTRIHFTVCWSLRIVAMLHCFPLASMSPAYRALSGMTCSWLARPAVRTAYISWPLPTRLLVRTEGWRGKKDKQHIGEWQRGQQSSTARKNKIKTTQPRLRRVLLTC